MQQTALSLAEPEEIPIDQRCGKRLVVDRYAYFHAVSLRSGGSHVRIVAAIGSTSTIGAEDVITNQQPERNAGNEPR
jgi:hypothetical protein